MKNTNNDNAKWMTDRLVIAGPCSAESEEQVLKTARDIAEIPQVTVFRAGIWKPRTRPNCFEGAGRVGLSWLKRVKEETGLMTATEVATANHVYEALRNDIDILWIGARTTVSPFAVQEIADALRGTDIPVLVKNPINPDLDLWMGALERLHTAGVKRLAAIHRGFSAAGVSPYRNAPLWDIPLELMANLPEIPVICDPSHMGGARKYIFELAQNGLDNMMTGLMIESHISPDDALSDSKQQLKPEELKAVLDSLIYPVGAGDTKADLDSLRGQIDSVDRKLLDMIRSRILLSQKIGQHKKKTQMPMYQPDRWLHLLEMRLNQAREMGLDENFIQQMYHMIHEQSIAEQGG